MSKCHFGLNIMKESVCVGLTTKSIDYFSCGLPIINNIKGDTWNIVEKYNVGINVKEVSTFANEYEKINIYEMKENVEKVYNRYFTINAFKRCLLECLEGGNKNG